MLKIKRLYKSFRYAGKGLIKVIREEQNIQAQLTFGAIVIILGCIFNIEKMEWLVLFITIGLVILMEIVNSAIERVSDILKPRIDSYVKEIKDIMAAAVMLSAILSIIIGLIIFLPHLIDLL